MAKRNRNTALFQKDLVKEALIHSFVKLNPKIMFRNPVMFTVELGTFIMLIVTIGTLMSSDNSQGSFGYNLVITIILFLTCCLQTLQKLLQKQEEKHKQILFVKQDRILLRRRY